jgi:hypothetical protein
LLDLGKRLSEAVERLALEISQQPELAARSEGLRDSLARLRERTDQVVKTLALA